MTVDELIESLQGIPGDTTVNVASDCCGCDLNHLYGVRFFEADDEHAAEVYISGSHEYVPIVFQDESGYVR